MKNYFFILITCLILSFLFACKTYKKDKLLFYDNESYIPKSAWQRNPNFPARKMRKENPSIYCWTPQFILKPDYKGRGCSEDNDNDGISDIEDKDPETPEGARIPMPNTLLVEGKNYVSLDSIQNKSENTAIENTEEYAKIIENEFVSSSQKTSSTFPISVSGAAYSNAQYCRYYYNRQQFPKNWIRLEEFINYFDYDYPTPKKGQTVLVEGEISNCPWDSAHKLVRIGIKAKEYKKSERPPSNWVFLIDVSCSMGGKLVALKKHLEILINKLPPEDRVALVLYAGGEYLQLPSTSLKNKSLIIKHLRKIDILGNIDGAQGFQTAYKIAKENYAPNANNHILFITDGIAYMEANEKKELIAFLQKETKNDISLSVLGLGLNTAKFADLSEQQMRARTVLNLFNEAELATLAHLGNGIYENVNTKEEIKMILGKAFDKFFIIAKDAKIQIEFNPEMVASYRLIGYENHTDNKQVFANEEKNTNHLHARQSLTALYEIIPAQRSSTGQAQNIRSLQINFRYKEPNESASKLISIDVIDENKSFEVASENMRFAATLASFGMLLRDSKFKGVTSLPQLKVWAEKSMTYDPNQYRAKFLALLKEIEKMP